MGMTRKSRKSKNNKLYYLIRSLLHDVKHTVKVTKDGIIDILVPLLQKQHSVYKECSGYSDVTLKGLCYGVTNYKEVYRRTRLGAYAYEDGRHDVSAIIAMTEMQNENTYTLLVEAAEYVKEQKPDLHFDHKYNLSNS